MGGTAAGRHTAVMQVFLVEDSPLIRTRLVEMLQSVPGATVCGHAASAENAIRQILAARPDVVVLDLSLAQGSGFDVLRAVHPQAPQIDFYMLSNFAADPYRQLAGRLGARDFFDKSKEFARVRDAIAARAAGH
jgi:two-component system, NarL family, response regulator DevR